MPDSQKLQVFLCHASQDKPIVRELYQRLRLEGWIDPWLDEEKLLPGQDWDMEIEKAVESSDAVIVCLSSRSVSKEGYVQKELRRVLDLALEKPENMIFIIPLRLEGCELPRRLRAWHYVDYFPAERQNWAFQRLLDSLRTRSGSSQPAPAHPSESLPSSAPSVSLPVGTAKEEQGNLNADIGWSIPLILYFLLVGWDVFIASSDLVEYMIALSAVPAGIAMLVKRQIPDSIWLKISLIVYLMVYGMGYNLEEIIPFAPELAGLAALATGGLWAAFSRTPKKQVFFSSIFVAIFLFLAGLNLVAKNLEYTNMSSNTDTLLLVTGLVTTVLVWRDL